MTCGYCEGEITDNQYTWKWFPDLQKFLPVHPAHLSTRRVLTPNEIQAEVDKRGRTTETPRPNENDTQ